MKKFETKEELVEWIETMHLQNANGRETEGEMFRLGIEAAIKELTEFNLLTIREQLLAYEEFTSYKVLGKKTKRISKQMVEDYLANNCA